MTVTREIARQKIVEVVSQTLQMFPGTRLRVPGFPPIDVSNNKSLYVNLDIIYLDGFTVGLGLDSTDRLMGQILVEANFKEGTPADLKLSNNVLDALQNNLSNRDTMYPVRTYSSKQHSPQFGFTSGWIREALLTPFWYDR